MGIHTFVVKPRICNNEQLLSEMIEGLKWAVTYENKVIMVCQYQHTATDWIATRINSAEYEIRELV